MTSIEIVNDGKPLSFALASSAALRISPVSGEDEHTEEEWGAIIKQTLASYLSIFPDESTRLRTLVDESNTSLSLASRQDFPGHVTGSGLVVDGNRALLIEHPGLKRWLQPGGHLENREAPYAAANREVEEETGWTVAPVVDADGNAALLDIDVHAIPENKRKNEPTHWHYDFLYIFAPLTQMSVPELPVKWTNLDQIDNPRLTFALSKLETLHRACRKR